MEFARLAGLELPDVLEGRFDVGGALAGRLGAAVLLKGVPTVVSAPDGRRLVSAAGTPALATAGSGDVLGGIAATLLAQMDDAAEAGACAAWAHGRAAELAGDATTRGVTLGEVERALADVWWDRVPSPAYPVLLELPAVP
jgi:NAD(P)H-hydrate epimerase